MDQTLCNNWNAAHTTKHPKHRIEFCSANLIQPYCETQRERLITVESWPWHFINFCRIEWNFAFLKLCFGEYYHVNNLMLWIISSKYSHLIMPVKFRFMPNNCKYMIWWCMQIFNIIFTPFLYYIIDTVYVQLYIRKLCPKIGGVGAVEGWWWFLLCILILESWNSGLSKQVCRVKIIFGAWSNKALVCSIC